MSTVKFGNKRAATYTSALLVGTAALLSIGSSSSAQKSVIKAVSPPAAPASAASAVPVAAAARLARLDSLRAQLEEEKLVRDIAKVRAEARDARAPALGAVAASAAPVPLSNFPAVASLEVPPLPPRSGGVVSAPRRAATPGISVLEAWGSGARQARISVDGNERLVRVGDRVGSAVVTSISDGELTLSNSKGQERKIN